MPRLRLQQLAKVTEEFLVSLNSLVLELGRVLVGDIITFDMVNKWYGSLHVLQDLCLRVKEKEIVVICGPSGSGKSTLIRCINRLEPIQKGELIVDEVERPARIDLGLHQDRRACSDGSPPSLALADCQPFFPIETIDAVDA